MNILKKSRLTNNREKFKKINYKLSNLIQYLLMFF